MDRITFIHSISGIQYPEMLINFFDQFIAMYQIVEDFGSIDVCDNDERTIEFSLLFKNMKNRDKALYNLQNGVVIVYGKSIPVIVNIVSDKELKIKLQQ